MLEGESSVHNWRVVSGDIGPGRPTVTSTRTARAKALKKRKLQAGAVSLQPPRVRCWPVRFSGAGREAEKWAPCRETTGLQCLSARGPQVSRGDPWKQNGIDQSSQSLKQLHELDLEHITVACPIPHFFPKEKTQSFNYVTDMQFDSYYPTLKIGSKTESKRMDNRNRHTVDPNSSLQTLTLTD